MSARRTVVESEPEQILEPFHVRYRPRSLKDVIGQDAVVKAIKANLAAASKPHSFLFTGPSGCGKTTLARIIAAGMNCAPANIIEIDAASNSGIDPTKDLVSTLRYQGFGDQPNKAIIIDECHALSKAAWQVLLKPMEEPPPHIFFFLCTTETGKVPETIVTRCQNYALKPCRYDDLMDLLEMVADAEKLTCSDAVLKIVADACAGSPRQALVMLAMVQACTDPGEAAAILASSIDNAEIIDLCRLLISNKEITWTRVTSVLRGMPEMQAESIRIVLANYLAGCLMNAKNDKEATRILDVLAPFSRPFATTDKLAPLLLAFGDLLYR